MGFAVIGWVIIGQVFGGPAAYASIDIAERNYLNNEYELSLEQFKETWVEEDPDACENYGQACESYWEREYDGSVVVRQDGVAELELNKKTKFSPLGPRPETEECEWFVHEGELFSVAGDGARQLVSGSGWEGFQPQEGVYEADVYFACIYQVRNDSFVSRLFAWLKPKVAHATPYGDYVGTIRFTVVDKDKPEPAPLTLPEKAAELAKGVIGADYLGDGQKFGGKGWDPIQNSYVQTSSIFNGYDFWNNKSKKVDFGAGLDCSGLIEWAYNYSFDPQKSLTKNVIRVEGANKQYLHNSSPVSESELAKGDLLFLDKNNDGHVDHVAMYVGGFIDNGESFDVIEAFSRERGIVPANKDLLKDRNGFKNLGLNKAIRRVVISPEIAGQVKVGSPVDIAVTDPEGTTITPDTFIETDEEYLREVPGELYYSEREFGEDGRPKDTVYWFKKKIGDYRIEVIPEKGTVPTDTYSLEFTQGDNTITLAENVPISEIPEGGYFVSVSDTGEVGSSGEVTSEYLLEKIKTHIQSFDIKESAKKSLLALTNAIGKRLEINLKLQEKFEMLPALKKQLERVKENERAILEKLIVEEKIFGEKESKKLTSKEVIGLTKALTRVLLTFQD